MTRGIYTFVLVGALCATISPAIAQNPPAGAQGGNPAGQAGGGQAAGRGPALPDIRGVVTPPTQVTGTGNYAHTVGDLDSAVAFYRDAIGFTVVTPPDKPKKDAALSKLYNTPGAKFRTAVLSMPKTPYNFELMEITGADGKKMPALLEVDPGNSALNMTTPDLASMWPKIEQMGGKALSAEGKPRPQGTGSNIFTTDNQGCNVEIRQPGTPRDGGPISDNAWPTVLAATTTDSHTKVVFYRDVLGFSSMQEGTPRLGNAGVFAMVGGHVIEGTDPSKVGFEQSQGNVPGTAVRFEFYQYWGASNTPFKPRVQDACATVWKLYVRDMDEMLSKIKDSSTPIVTEGGKPVAVDGAKHLVISDPDGLYIELIEKK
jgi:predicted enzyme related to lactoylglutathione lyase